MNTSYNKYDSIEKFIFDEGLRIQSVRVIPEQDILLVYLSNSHQIKTRLSLFEKLTTANAGSLMNCRLIANGTGIHWPDLDEDLSLKGFLKEYLRQKVNGEKELVIA